MHKARLEVADSHPLAEERAQRVHDLGALVQHHRRVHDAVPILSRGHARQDEHARGEVVEIHVAVEGPVLHDAAEEAHADHGVDEVEQEEDAEHVPERGHGAEQRLEEREEPRMARDEAEDAQDAEDVEERDPARLGEVPQDGAGEAQERHTEVEGVPGVGDVRARALRRNLEQSLGDENEREGVVQGREHEAPRLVHALVLRRQNPLRRDQAKKSQADQERTQVTRELSA